MLTTKQTGRLVQPRILTSANNFSVETYPHSFSSSTFIRQLRSRILEHGRLYADTVMDHVPIPTNCTRIPLEVPFLAQHEFDGLEFQSFPQRTGWTLPRLSRLALAASIDNAPTSDILPAAAFLQSWLYFGMLDCILGQHMPFSTFTRQTSDGRKVLCTAKLPELLSDWAVQEPSEPKSLVLQRAKAMNRVLGYAAFILRSFRSGPKSLLSHELFLSIAALCDILTLAKLAVVGHRAGSDDESQDILKEAIAGQHTGFICDFPALGLFKEWCPYDVERLYQTANPSTMYFAGHLTPLRRSDHSICTKTHCLAASSLHLTSNPRKPTKASTLFPGFRAVRRFLGAHGSFRKRPHPQHRTADCRCSVVSITKEQLDEIIQQDEVPVICLKVKDSEVVASVAKSSDVSYIAISHVWSDGLGNEMANALAVCQVSHLASLARGSRTHGTNNEDVRLWIDTLCVPISGPGRKKAITMMARIYREADIVLALDQGLQTATADVPKEELLVHIVSSRWLSRLWTLQEGAFAKQLLFQFRDRTVDLDELTKTEIDHTLLKGVSEYVVYANLHNNLLNMRMVGASDQSVAEKRVMINGVINNLLWRQTTKPVDEWTCLSTLLGLDVTAVLAADPALRPAVALSQQIFFPKSILFNSGPRQSLPGFRWAPKSFLRPPQSLDMGSAGIIGSESEAMCTSKGLFVRLPGMELSLPASSLLGKFEVFEPKSNIWLRVVLCDEEQSLDEQFDSIQPKVDRVHVDPEHNTWPYPSWMLIFNERYQPGTHGNKDTAVLGYVAGAASIGRGFEGFVVRYVQRVLVVTKFVFDEEVVRGPDLSHMHGKPVNNFPWYIG